MFLNVEIYTFKFKSNSVCLLRYCTDANEIENGDTFILEEAHRLVFIPSHSINTSSIFQL